MADNDELTVPGNIGEPVGWAWFSQVDAEFDQHREPDEKEILKRAYEATFKSKSGQIVLDDLMKRLKNVAMFDPDIGFYNGAAMGFTREGENRIIMYIDTMSKPLPIKGAD